jgi:hypothetical protein
LNANACQDLLPILKQLRLPAYNVCQTIAWAATFDFADDLGGYVTSSEKLQTA